MGLIRGALFLVFVVLGLGASLPRLGPLSRSVRINAFIVFTLLLSFAAGISQREVWPFSTWPLIAGTVPTPVIFPRWVALDARGREYPIDYRAWHPFEFDEFAAWWGDNGARMNARERNEASSYLVAKIESARRNWLDGQVPWPGPLGPLGSPYFLAHPPLWSDAGRIPREPLVGLRLYEERWDVEARLRNPSAVTRRLVYEYRQP